ncbi:hypothetical protein Tco_0280390 [Tanacetum coccineum]
MDQLTIIHQAPYLIQGVDSDQMLADEIALCLPIRVFESNDISRAFNSICAYLYCKGYFETTRAFRCHMELLNKYAFELSCIEELSDPKVGCEVYNLGTGKGTYVSSRKWELCGSTASTYLMLQFLLVATRGGAIGWSILGLFWYYDAKLGERKLGIEKKFALELVDTTVREATRAVKMFELRIIGHVL